MATLEQQENQLKQLQSALTELNALDSAGLVRADALGRQLNFSTAVPFFERTIRLFRDLSAVNLDNVSYQRLVSLTQSATQAMAQFKRVQEFSLETSPQNPVQARDQLINEIRDNYDQYFENVFPIISYGIKKGTDFENLEFEARRIVAQINSSAVQATSSAEAQLKQIGETLEKVRRAAAEVGVAQHATHFRDEAQEHDKSARVWLLTTFVVGLITVLAGMASLWFFISSSSLSSAQTVQVALAKLAIFSVLFSSLVAGGRIYRAHRHNYVINRHRQNALSTFETFVKAASDEQTKSAVLLQATQCIFSPQPSGYVHQENEASTYPPFVEILNGIAGSGKK